MKLFTQLSQVGECFGPCERYRQAREGEEDYGGRKREKTYHKDNGRVHLKKYEYISRIKARKT